MRYLLAGGILIIGVVIGFFLGRISVKDPKIANEPSEGYITKTIYDTIVKTETVEVAVDPKGDEEENIKDTTDVDKDTTEQLSPPDSSYEDLPIRTEKLIDSKWLSVIVLDEEEKRDSLIQEMMEVKESKPKKILVEFWESPLHFSGYKLSKSKLILYELPSNLDYKLYRKKDKYYLAANTLYYSLKESEEFLPYLEVSKEVVFSND